MSLPKHIAIIMDGNRRWAKEKKLDPKLGHKEGAKVLEKIVRYANEIGIEYVTVYAFSTENWKRTEEEVGALMLLLEKYLNDFSKKADTENIKICVLGDISKLSKNLVTSIENAIDRTKNNTGCVFNIAFNYGGRDEIVHACNNVLREATITGKMEKYPSPSGTFLNHEEMARNEGVSPMDDSQNSVSPFFTEELISKNLYTKGQPDPDLLIRTSGEQRLSGFLLWQLAYAELYFVKKHWPDFTEKDLDEAIEEYNRRTRKFGGN